MELKQKKPKPPNQRKDLHRELFAQRNLTEASTLCTIFTSAKPNIFNGNNYRHSISSRLDVTAPQKSFVRQELLVVFYSPLITATTKEQDRYTTRV